MMEFLEFGGKPGFHQQVYHPEVFRWIVVTTEDMGGGDEVGVPINGAFGNQRGIITVNVERCPLELTKVNSESPPGLDTVKRAKENNPK